MADEDMTGLSPDDIILCELGSKMEGDMTDLFNKYVDLMGPHMDGDPRKMLGMMTMATAQTLWDYHRLALREHVSHDKVDMVVRETVTHAFDSLKEDRMRDDWEPPENSDKEDKPAH